MSHFLKLPTDVCNDIISTWLNTSDWGKLDSSYCSKDGRALFLGILEMVKCFSTGSSPKVYSWLYSKRIDLHRIHLCPQMFGKVGKDEVLLCDINFTAVKEILVDVKPTPGVFELINRCSNLEGIESGDGTFIANMDPKVLQKIKGVAFNYSQEFEAVTSAILQHCRNLTVLRTMGVMFELVDSFVDKFIDIIKHNPSLENVLIPAGKGTFLALAEHCKAIRNVTAGLMVLPTAEVGQFLTKSAATLQWLTLEDYDYHMVTYQISKKMKFLTVVKGDAELHALVAGATGMQVIQLIECDLSSGGDVISALTRSCTSSMLSLNLEACTGLTAESLLLILSQCKMLNNLEVDTNWKAIALSEEMVTSVSNGTVKNLFLKGHHLPPDTVLLLLRACPQAVYCYATITTADRAEALPLLRWARSAYAESRRLITQFDFNQSLGMMSALMHHTPGINEPATVVHDEKGFTGMNHGFYTKDL